MTSLKWFWERFEECFIAILLMVMTLVTFAYVVFNNLYNVFFDLADQFPSTANVTEPIGDFIMTMAQEMTWSLAITKACFGWLIFFGASYGVRTAGHIGVDVLVKKLPRVAQKWVSIVAVLACIGYGVIIASASYEWVETMYIADIGADDLNHFNVKIWHIGLIMPIGFGLIAIRFIEILVRLLANKQVNLGLADESEDALKLAQGDEK
ncbi:TRAP transporter small permease [Otariodibacter oris]|uniref:TRAP transporter small permease protein n=1 Tax=Otariodibacter oris TaxID=1032623 RepID=A0A420XEK4_9PAST|nr:TRAP transporter small permease [Otariodibacter oris]QGM80199.1 C4-dicarboxylate ABC transporter [Otariodibacter oris]RKR70612.1 C4-dicarboxylate transporter DctQ subunit [Otariodibacter oris]